MKFRVLYEEFEAQQYRKLERTRPFWKEAEYRETLGSEGKPALRLKTPRDWETVKEKDWVARALQGGFFVIPESVLIYLAKKLD